MRQWIGVDIGTQGTKGILFDAVLHPLASAFRASHLIQPQAGTVWQEPSEILQSVVEVLSELMHAASADANAVGGIGIDSQMAGILGIGVDGESVTVYDSWLDTRCAPQIEQMRVRAEEAVTQITGGPVSCTHGPKILWLQQEQPSVFAQVEKFVLPHSYVVCRLAGLDASAAYFDHTCLQYSGFGDNANRCWSNELLQAFGVPRSKMARIVSPFEVIGGMSEGMARRCGLKSGTPLVAGAGDTAATIFGTGMFEPGYLLDCAGTASVLCGVVDRYVPDTEHQTLSMMRSPEDGLWFPLAYISGGGMSLRWIRDQLGGSADYEALEKLAQDVPPGSEGLLFIPHWSGRVLPSDPTMKGAYLGMDLKHTVAHLYRAAMEGVAYEYDVYLQALRNLFPTQTLHEMLSVGGGAKSRLMMQIKADVLGLPVRSFQLSDAALCGSAAIAAHGTGCMPDYRERILTARQERLLLEPQQSMRTCYHAASTAYRDALAALSAFYKGGSYTRMRN